MARGSGGGSAVRYNPTVVFGPTDKNPLKSDRRRRPDEQRFRTQDADPSGRLLGKDVRVPIAVRVSGRCRGPSPLISSLLAGLTGVSSPCWTCLPHTVLTGLPQKSIKQLQLIQNAAARVLTRTKRSEHITPVLKSLHWLPVSYIIDFKVLLLVYKSLNGLGPEYMNDILVEYKPSRALRSTDSGQIVEPRVQTKHGEAAFSRYAAQNWNKLPAELNQPQL